MGKGAPKAKASAQEKLNAQNALDTLRRHQEFVLPLEIEEIQRTYDPAINDAKQNVLNRSAGFGAMAAEAQARAAERALSMKTGTSLSSAGNLARLGEAGTTGAQGAAAALAQSETTGDQMRLDKKFGLLNTGQGLSNQYSQGLANMAQDSTTVGIAKMEADNQVRMARAKAIGDVAMTGVTLGARSWAAGADPDVPFSEKGILGKMRSTHRAAKDMAANDWELGSPEWDAYRDSGVSKAMLQSNGKPWGLGRSILSQGRDLTRGLRGSPDDYYDY